jgi:hypothetical protein
MSVFTLIYAPLYMPLFGTEPAALFVSLYPLHIYLRIAQRWLLLLCKAYLQVTVPS